MLHRCTNTLISKLSEIGINDRMHPSEVRITCIDKIWTVEPVSSQMPSHLYDVITFVVYVTHS